MGHRVGTVRASAGRRRGGAGLAPHWRALGRGVVALLFAIIPFAIAVPTAWAGTGMTAVPSLSTPDGVGSANLPGQLTITNTSNGAEASGNLTINLITLVMSCGTGIGSNGDCPMASRDPGVLRPSATGVGAAGTACAGTAFSFSLLDATQGKYQLTPGSTVVLPPPPSMCVINFVFDVLKVPTMDANAGVAGIQTDQLGFAFGTAADAVQGGGGGTGEVTVNKGPSSIVTQESSQSIVLGGTFHDTATLGAPLPGASSLTGTVQFNVYAPGDTNCTGGTAFSSLNAVSSSTAVSGVFAPNAAGTYRVIATYSGDANYQGTQSMCQDATEMVTVTKATLSIVTQVAPSSITVGNSFHDTATLGAPPQGAPVPTGTVTFKVYGPTDATCTGALLFTSTNPVNPSGTVSNNFAPTTTGTYRVVATYNGDSNYTSVTTSCGDVSETVTVTGGVTHVRDDFDGDGKSDVAVFRPSSGTWYILNSGGGTTVTSWGASGDIPVAGDYNGDGKTDVAVYRPSTGTWYILNSGGGTTVTGWGASGDIPVPGDYNGDGKTDVAVYRPSTGTWYILNSGGGTTVTSWGASGDIPVAGDYNGDGKTDVAVFRPSSGTWYILNSGGGTTVTSWGASTDTPVVGDYNGDGKADVAVFRPSTGTWYILNSGGGTTVTSWGASTDTPVVGDYNGDGKADVAVFRPSTGTWYILNSGGGTTVTSWGASGDVPIG